MKRGSGTIFYAVVFGGALLVACSSGYAAMAVSETAPMPLSAPDEESTAALTTRPVAGVDAAGPYAHRLLSSRSAGNALATYEPLLSRAVGTAPAAQFEDFEDEVPPVVKGSRRALREFLREMPRLESLADVGDDEAGNPLVDFSYLSLAPRGFALVRSGRPGGDAKEWAHTIETGLSYVGRHRNLQFVVDLAGSEGPREALSRAPVDVRASMVDNLSVEVDSTKIAPASAAYGEIAQRKASASSGAESRMVAVGINLGLIPAILADVSASATVAIGRSENPGPFISVSTNLELPSEPPQELTVNTMYHPRTDILTTNPGRGGLAFTGGFAENEQNRDVPEGGGERIPIVPERPVPEPATCLLLGAGLAALSLRRRRHR